MKSAIHEDLTWMHIHSLKLSCMVGIHNWEQHIPQNLYLDISFGYPRVPGHKDNIRRVTDYARIADSICQYCARQKFHLLESWMDGIGEHVFATFPGCEELRLSLSKPCALENADRVTLSCSYRRETRAGKTSS
ncbi:MAG: dihydroneopterin aldolase [Gammaproteobacteria bacterium]|nr:dihydroneopterin aldolase [Pseudomonadota bacterium]MCH9663715.1 dihydroneopterin aldolase [Gammaproteobacteria bacterium]